MKNLAIIAILTVAASAAEARVFQPWGNVTTESGSNAAQAATAPKTGTAFYGAGLPKTIRVPAAEQANIVIKPWYAKDRV